MAIFLKLSLNKWSILMARIEIQVLKNQPCCVLSFYNVFGSALWLCHIRVWIISYKLHLGYNKLLFQFRFCLCKTNLIPSTVFIPFQIGWEFNCGYSPLAYHLNGVATGQSTPLVCFVIAFPVECKNVVCDRYQTCSFLLTCKLLVKKIVSAPNKLNKA